MLSNVGAQLALLAFTAATLLGLHAGNEPATILIRAFVIMAATLALGRAVAALHRLILRDHLQGRKLSLDRAHLEACAAAAPAAEAGAANATE